MEKSKGNGGKKAIIAVKIAEDDASYPDKNTVVFINFIVGVLVESTLRQFNDDHKEIPASSDGDE